mgnify:CR=1 FL=1
MNEPGKAHGVRGNVQTDNRLQSLQADRNRLRIRLFIIVVLGLSSFMSSLIIYPTLPLYILDIGGTKLELGLILSVSSITVVLMRIPLGILSDRLGGWNFLSLSLIGQSVSSFLYIVVPDTGWLYPLRAIHAVAAAVFHPVLISFTSGLVRREQRGRILSIYLTTPAASMMVGPAVNSFLVERGGYVATFVVAGFLSFGGFLVSVLTRRARFFEQAYVPLLGAERSSRSESIVSLLKNLVLSRRVATISIARASFSTTDGIFGAIFAILVVQSLSLPVYMVGLFFAVKGLANTLVRWPVGIFADRVGGKRPALVAFVATAVAFAVLSEAQPIWLIAVTMVMIGLAWGTRAVTEWVLVANLPGGSTTIGTAYLSTMFDIGEAVGALLAGVLMTALPLPSIFKIAAMIVAVGVVPLAMTRM